MFFLSIPLPKEGHSFFAPKLFRSSITKDHSFNTLFLIYNTASTSCSWYATQLQLVVPYIQHGSNKLSLIYNTDSKCCSWFKTQLRHVVPIIQNSGRMFAIEMFPHLKGETRARVPVYGISGFYHSSFSPFKYNCRYIILEGICAYIYARKINR